jgi:DNA-directed RNA polymerase subunit omega
MRDDFFKAAQKIIDDPYVLVNVVSLRVKQLNRGHRPLVESLEKLSPTDIALREIAEGRITYEMVPLPPKAEPVPFSLPRSAPRAVSF